MLPSTRNSRFLISRSSRRSSHSPPADTSRPSFHGSGTTTHSPPRALSTSASGSTFPQKSPPRHIASPFVPALRRRAPVVGKALTVLLVVTATITAGATTVERRTAHQANSARNLLALAVVVLGSRCVIMRTRGNLGLVYAFKKQQTCSTFPHDLLVLLIHR